MCDTISCAWLLISYFTTFELLLTQIGINHFCTQWAISSFLQWVEYACIDINQNGVGELLVKSQDTADPLYPFPVFYNYPILNFYNFSNSTFGTISRKSISNLKSALHFLHVFTHLVFPWKNSIRKGCQFFLFRSFKSDRRKSFRWAAACYAMTFNEENYWDQSAENDHFNLHFCQQFNKVWPPSQHKNWMLTRHQKQGNPTYSGWPKTYQNDPE